ncbi:cobalamin-binding protein [Nitrosopumilus piranensis]|uniref:Periplasmic binding protein n=1 Tax=Nitrosopumilus piranensis TaxID=1582439 RepID=A0A0C5BZG4_9ARCH|nr:cobalamin-binding protein [Nitrosopumilus piranensis]AJM92390.1 Periplasmic binding protein [Nitrosopumilus piranensis]
MEKRIVSFLPSATELIYELGAQEDLYGVTHECKFPTEASLKPKVINSVIDSEKLTSSQINTITCQLLNDKKDIFELNEKNLIDANPDIIITQETCSVCAAYTNQVNKAIKILEKKPSVYSMDPHNLEEIFESVREIGIVLGREVKAQEILESLKKRIQKIKNRVKDKSSKVLALEWLDPFFTAGHWIPEMIKIAGGRNLISRAGEHSRRMSFEEVKESNPDIIILMPCGFDVKRTVLEYKSILAKNQAWLNIDAVKNNKVFAVDANSFFSKPSIRTIEGIEILAKIIHPNEFQKTIVSENSFSKIE